MELSGRDDEDLTLQNMGAMRYAEYFETHGTCCWKLFKRENLPAAKGKMTIINNEATDLTKNKFKFKSVKKVDCKESH